jgi:GLPGLI family protein
MKIKLIILLFLATLINQSYCQTLKGILTETPLKGVGDNTELSKKAAKPMIFSYVFSEKKSIQNLISLEKTSIDTSYIEKYGTKYETTSSVSRPTSLSYYKDLETKKYKVVATQEAKDFNIVEKLTKFDWKLINENKIINGYTCKKATTTNTAFNSNQSIVAWYTEAIPVNDGPGQYQGLPGFIIQIEIDDNSISTFDKLVFSKENTPIEEPNNSVPELSFSEYSKQSAK